MFRDNSTNGEARVLLVDTRGGQGFDYAALLVGGLECGTPDRARANQEKCTPTCHIATACFRSQPDWLYSQAGKEEWGHRMIKFKDQRGEPANWVLVVSLIILVAIGIVSFSHL
jgi:hypothetical protein